jgi:hypothetical protein
VATEEYSEEDLETLKKMAHGMSVIIEQSVEHGAVVCEALQCSKCQNHSYIVHRWTETIQCQTCGMTHASRVPRLPMPGEVTLDHLTQALATLRQTYANVPNCKFSEWDTLDDKTKLLVTSNITAAVVAAMDQVEKLALAFANQANKLAL